MCVDEKFQFVKQIYILFLLKQKEVLELFSNISFHFCMSFCFGFVNLQFFATFHNFSCKTDIFHSETFLWKYFPFLTSSRR